MTRQADAQLLNRLEYLSTKLMNINMNIYFNKTRKKLKIIPKYKVIIFYYKYSNFKNMQFVYKH